MIYLCAYIYFCYYFAHSISVSLSVAEILIHIYLSMCLSQNSMLNVEPLVEDWWKMLVTKPKRVSWIFIIESIVFLFSISLCSFAQYEYEHSIDFVTNSLEFLIHKHTYSCTRASRTHTHTSIYRIIRFSLVYNVIFVFEDRSCNAAFFYGLKC